jgi:hypothetical protein
MFIFGGNDIHMGTNNNLWEFDLKNLGELKET